jgi:hypothetical protein
LAVAVKFIKRSPTSRYFKVTLRRSIYAFDPLGQIDRNVGQVNLLPRPQMPIRVGYNFFTILFAGLRLFLRFVLMGVVR